MKVLHVTDAWAAGVATAVQGWIEACSTVEHAVLARGRDGIPMSTPDGTEVLELPAGPFAAARALRQAVRATGAQVVHAHSSRAGVLARVVPAGAAVVYTPHGFAFQRTDVRATVRRSFRAAEWLLARRPATTVACGAHEAELARALGRPGRVVAVPYAPPEAPAVADAVTREPTAELAGRVVFMGRLAPQKGVPFAAGVIAELRRRRPDLELVWVGGGPAEDAALLRQAGASVTGWVDRAEALRMLAVADVYVHTAAWEGLPLTVLEALAAGVPVVARRLGSLDELGVQQAETPAGVAALVEAVLTPGGRSANLLSTAVALAARPRTEEIGARLADAYRSALHQPGVSSPSSAANRTASSA